MKTTLLNSSEIKLPKIIGNVHTYKPSKKLTSVMLDHQTIATFSNVNGLNSEKSAMLFVEALKIQQSIDLSRIQQLVDLINNENIVDREKLISILSCK